MRISFLLVLTMMILGMLQAQTREASLLEAIERTAGIDKLKLLHDLTQEYFDSNETKKALKTARQATSLADRIITVDNELITEEDHVLKSTSYYMMGKAFYKRQQFSYAKKYFQESIRASLELHRFDHIEDSEGFIAKIDQRSDGDSKFKTKLKELQFGISDQLIASSNDVSLTATLKVARNYEANENYEKAIEKYEKAILMLEDKGDSKQLLELKEHIALLHQKSGDYDNAITAYQEIGEIKDNAGDSIAVSRSEAKIAEIKDEVQDRKLMDNPTIDLASKSAPIVADQKVVNNPQNIRDLASRLEESKDYEQSISYYKLYIETSEKLQEEEYNRELALLEQSNEIEMREQEISLLQQEKDLQELRLARNNEELAEQARFRNSLIIGSILIASLAIALYLLYNNKRRAHSQLTHAYDDLNQTQGKLAQAEHRIKTLLKQQVSEAVAQELLSQEKDEKIEKKFVCVMFLDIRGFTPFAEMRSPEDIIQYQNDVFGFMIEIIERNHGIINQFLGDGFMATFGAPVSHGNDCENAYTASREIVKRLNELNELNKIPFTRVGIGLHAGPVVAGNVGTEERKQYSITGNTVIIAARIEQLNKQYNTQLIISEDVQKHLEDSSEADLKYEDVMVKGRSEPIRILKVA